MPSLANLDEVMVEWGDWHFKDSLKSSAYRPMWGASLFLLTLFTYVFIINTMVAIF